MRPLSWFRLITHAAMMYEGEVCANFLLLKLQHTRSRFHQWPRMFLLSRRKRVKRQFQMPHSSASLGPFRLPVFMSVTTAMILMVIRSLGCSN